MMTKSGTINIGGFHGDGIGPEVYPYYGKLLQAGNEALGTNRFDVTELPYDGDSYEASHADPKQRKLWEAGVPDELMAKFDAFLLTACGHPRVGMAHAFPLIIGFLRNKLRTNMNERPIWLPNPDLRPEVVKSPVNLEVFAVSEADQSIREEVEHEGTDRETVRVVEKHPLAAFKAKLLEAVEKAMEMGEDRIAVANKSNILKNAHGPWLDVIKEVQAAHPDLKILPLYMDSFLSDVVRFPERIPKVIVTDRGFGELLLRAKEVLARDNRSDVPDQIKHIIARENLKGMYISKGGVEGEGDDRVGEQVGEYTYQDVLNHLDASVKIARQNGYHKVTIVNDGTMHPKTKALWESALDDVERDHGDIAFNSIYLADYVEILMTAPGELNDTVFACTNLGGDIAGDGAAGLVGGMGIPATHSWNSEGKGTHYFEYLGGTADAIVGQGTANPTSTILTGAEVFAAYGELELRATCQQAVANVLRNPEFRTPDMGGKSNTVKTGDAIIAEFERLTKAA